MPGAAITLLGPDPNFQGGTSNAPFDFTINGVRAGYADYQVMHNAADVVPGEVHNPQRGQLDE